MGMKGVKDKKLIGIMVDNIYTDFSKEIIHGVVTAIPADQDIQLVVLAGEYNSAPEKNSNLHLYKQVFNSIYQLGAMGDLDGLIISLGSLGTIARQEKALLCERISGQYSDIPKVYIASDFEGCITVNYDNEMGIREAVDYLVNVNGCSRLGMLGGREDNVDARLRRQLYEKCLKDDGIIFEENAYEKTDMSENSQEAAERLLDRNPDVQAIFCVNDSVAKGLYEVMAKRGLVPGKDIMVFGFDNTRLSGELIPSLTSIGSDEETLGQKALELVLRQLANEKVVSALLPTRVYGRESFAYQSYEYTTMEMLKADEAFIYRMFDDCFYRYRAESIDREKIDLRRLFYEFMSRMLKGMQRHYLSMEEFQEIGRLIDIFFENGGMNYTDAQKLLKSIDRLHGGINFVQRSVYSSVLINQLFLRMEDRAICALSDQKNRERRAYTNSLEKLKKFMILGTDYSGENEKSFDRVIRNLDKLGLRNAAFYMYDEPVDFRNGDEATFPEKIKLRCVMKAGELYLMQKERQDGFVRMIFRREELPVKCKGFVAFSVFYGTLVYGILLCELTPDIYDRGSFIADQLGRMIYLNDERVQRR